MTTSSTTALAFTISSLLSLPLSGQTKGADPIEDNLRSVFTEYKKGNMEAATAKMREALKMMEEKGSKDVAPILPDKIEGWKAESLKREDLSIAGGGLSLSRLYKKGGLEVTVKIIKDSPLVKQLIPLLSNEDLIRAANRKTHRIAGETAVMDGETKMQMVVDKRILVEFSGGEGTEEKDLGEIGRKLDLSKLSSLK